MTRTRPTASETLRRTAAFRDIAPAALRALTRQAEWIDVRAGEALISEGDAGDDLFVVVRGHLSARATTEQNVTIDVGELFPYDVIGEVQVVSGGTRSASVVAREDSSLYRIDHARLDELGDDAERVFQLLTDLARQRLYRAQLGKVLQPILGALPSDLIGAIAKKISWVSLKRGDTLFEQGDEADGWYIVVYGRLQVLGTNAYGERELRGEIFRGESLGESAILTGGTRNATVIAARDTQLVRFSNEDFLETLEGHPSALMSVSKLLASRLGSAPEPSAQKKGPFYVAVLPSDENAPSSWVATELVAALSRWGKTLHLNPALLAHLDVVRDPETLPLDHPAWSRFLSWFHTHSESFAFVVLETTTSAPAWTERVLGLADDTLIVADASAPATPSAFEKKALASGHGGLGSKRVLALVHPPETARPSGTRSWLVQRAVDLHLHLRAQNTRDIERLARVLSGRAVGLVLGGGGARGLAHLGVLRALDEDGVPIDFVGGTSMGAVIGAQYAMGYSHKEMLALNREVIKRRPFQDYTIPMMALVKTKRLDEVSKLAFGETDIEDLWLNYFAVSSDLRAAEVVVHERGALWKATRASGALPGIVPPIAEGDRLLVDGGLLNNLPADVMRSKCRGTVIVVEVTPEFDLSAPTGGIPTSWKLFWNRVLPLTDRIPVPGLFELLARATTLSGARAKSRVQQDADLYIEPDIDRYGLMDFDRIDELVDVGYRTAKVDAPKYRGPRIAAHAISEPRPTSIAPKAMNAGQALADEPSVVREPSLVREPAPKDPDMPPRKSLLGSLNTPMLLVQGALTGRRATHGHGIAASGKFFVVDDANRPAHDFFTSGRTFPAVVRFATVTWRDQASCDVRGCALRLAPVGTPSPFDMGLNTGVVSPAANIPAFAALVASKWAPRSAVIKKLSADWRAREVGWIGLRRAPECFTLLRYHSQTIRHWIDPDGKTWLVRYRILAEDPNVVETGATDERDWLALWDRHRRPEETRPTDYLSQRITKLLSNGGTIRMRFEAQFQPVTEDMDLEWYNSTLEWPVETHPWRSLGLVVLDTRIDDEVAERLEFNTGNHPPTLPVPASPDLFDYRSMADVERRSIAAAQRVRRLTYRLRGLPPPTSEAPKDRP